MSAPLKLCDDGMLTVATELDSDDELLVEVDYDCGLSLYVKLPEMKQLRDKLNELLEGK